MFGGTKMATTDKEQLQGIRTTWREDSGLSGTDDISNAAIDVRINDFYKGPFMEDIYHTSLESDFTQATIATDDGDYNLASTILEVQSRATFNNAELIQYNNRDEFFREHPNQEDYITNPTLVIGTSSTAAVKNASFNYEVSDWTYTKAAAETALSGDSVPQSTYGAWMLSLPADGTVVITPAGDNSTGYATPGLAVNGINTSVTGSIMGFVTAINTDAVFDPGTTDLDASGVTATFTDGNPGLRMTPNAFFVDGRTLFLRPKPDDAGLFEARLMYTLPSELDDDTAEVFDEKWGYAIAAGDAASYWATHGDTEKANQLNGHSQMPGTYKYLITRINRDWYKQQRNKPTERVYLCHIDHSTLTN